MWHFITEHWRVLTFIGFALIALFIYYIIGPFFGCVTGRDGPERDCDSMGRTLFVFAVGGLVAQCFTPSFLIALGGGMLVAILAIGVTARWPRPSKTTWTSNESHPM